MTSKKPENSQSESITLRALENSEKRQLMTQSGWIPTRFVTGYTLHRYIRFPSNLPLRMAASKLFAGKLEKSTFFVYVSLSR
jgi:hypothetical protein